MVTQMTTFQIQLQLLFYINLSYRKKQGLKVMAKWVGCLTSLAALKQTYEVTIGLSTE